MENEQFEIWMIEYLSDALDENNRKQFDRFLQDNPERQKQFDRLSQVWGRIDIESTPEPSEKMDEQFFDMLRGEMDKEKKVGNVSANWFPRLLENLWKPQMAYGILLLGIGLMAGYLLNSGQAIDQVPTTITSNPEIEEVREQLVLTLLEQPSANKRLKAVSEATKLNSATKRVIAALFTTLNNDSNINVRLAAVESLAKYVENPEVRMGLIQSIGKQDSPLVQLALADLMVALQEKSSIEPMKQLLEQPNLDTTVKQKLEESINHII
ncbi:MAG: HEAT repeat domain-containing protein [Aurantibacter sp.]